MYFDRLVCSFDLLFLQYRYVGIRHDRITAKFLPTGLVVIDHTIENNPAMMDTLLHATVAFSDARLTLLFTR